MNTLLDEDISKILKTYKIPAEEVEKVVSNNLDVNLKLRRLLEGKNENVKRTGEYKDFIKKVRKEIYYKLRKYSFDKEGFEAQLTILRQGYDKTTLDKKASENKLDGTPFEWFVQNHASTRERSLYIKEFNERLVNFIKEDKHILDLGGGLYPLTFPFSALNNLRQYTWVDKDKDSWNVLKEFCKTTDKPKINLYNELIGAREWKEYLPNNTNDFDTVLMLKLVPVIQRQEKDLLEILAKAPTKRFIVTGSKDAMTRNKDIEKRERHVCEKFITLTNRKVVGQFEIENEFAYVLASP